LPFHLSSTTIDQVERRSRSESPCTIFVNLLLMIRHKIGFEHSNAFPETAILALKIRTQAQPGRTVRTERLIFVPIHSAWNYQERFIVNGERRRFLNCSMVVLLKWKGKCSSGRAKLAHVGSHLP